MNSARNAVPNSASSIRRRSIPPLRVLALALALAPAAATQSITTAFNGTPIGGLGPNQVFFNLNVQGTSAITIQSLDLNLSDAPGTTGTINVRTIPLVPYLLPLSNLTTFGSWSLPAPGTVTAEGPGKPSHVCFPPTGITLAPGLHAIAIEYVGVFANATFVGPIPAAPSFAMTDGTLDFWYGDAQPVAWGALSPLHTVFNGTIFYEVGAAVPCFGCADKTPYGATCPSTCIPFPVLKLDSDFPVLGEEMTLETTGASTCAVIGVNIIGFTQLFATPLIVPNLLCWQHLTVDITMIGTPVAGEWSKPLQLPNDPFFCGLTFYSQSATLELPSGDIVSSNGLALTIGN